MVEITLNSIVMIVIISVIIPVYNVELYLKDCLDSVLNQSFRDIEVILVYDVSTDESIDILNNYAINDSRVRVINQENKGVSTVRNIGLDLFNGEYILFVDSDDMLIENSLEHIYNQSCEKDPEVLLGHAYRYFSNEEKVDFFYNKAELEKFEVADGKTLYSKLMERNLFPPLVYLFFCKKDFFYKYEIRFKKGIIREDELWCVMVICKANITTCAPFYTYLYRCRDGSIMNSNNYKYRIDSMKTVVSELCLIADNMTSIEELECSGLIYIRVFWLVNQIRLLSGRIHSFESLLFESCRFLILKVYNSLTYKQKNCV